MADRTDQEHAPGAKLHTAISNAIMLEQTLTKGEDSLVSKGRADKVIEIRHEFQEAMREECMAKIGELTGRKVTAMLSANHVDPDLGAEIFVLDAAPDYDDPRTAATDGDLEP